MVLPLGNLPAPDAVVQEINFIDLAVAEVRFDVRTPPPGSSGPPTGVISTLQGLAFRELAEQAGVSLPTVEPSERQEARLDLTSNGPVMHPVASNGVQLSTIDRRLALSVFADQLTVQHTDYARFRESFRPALRAALNGVSELLNAEVVRRVGLRYVNRLVDPEAVHAQAWNGRIRHSMLGMLADPALGSAVTGSQQQVQLDFGEACGVTVRHGAFADGAAHGRYSYLIDLDVYCQATDYFDAEAIMATLRRLNVTALSLFQWIVTPEWRATMSPHPADDENPAMDDTDNTDGFDPGPSEPDQLDPNQRRRT